MPIWRRFSPSGFRSGRRRAALAAPAVPARSPARSGALPLLPRPPAGPPRAAPRTGAGVAVGAGSGSGPVFGAAPPPARSGSPAPPSHRPTRWLPARAFLALRPALGTLGRPLPPGRALVRGRRPASRSSPRRCPASPPPRARRLLPLAAPVARCRHWRVVLFPSGRVSRPPWAPLAQPALRRLSPRSARCSRSGPVSSPALPPSRASRPVGALLRCARCRRCPGTGCSAAPPPPPSGSSCRRRPGRPRPPSALSGPVAAPASAAASSRPGAVFLRSHPASPPRFPAGAAAAPVAPRRSSSVPVPFPLVGVPAPRPPRTSWRRRCGPSALPWVRPRSAPSRPLSPVLGVPLTPVPVLAAVPLTPVAALGSSHVSPAHCRPCRRGPSAAGSLRIPPPSRPAARRAPPCGLSLCRCRPCPRGAGSLAAFRRLSPLAVGPGSSGPSFRRRRSRRRGCSSPFLSCPRPPACRRPPPAARPLPPSSPAAVAAAASPGPGPRPGLRSPGFSPPVLASRGWPRPFLFLGRLPLLPSSACARRPAVPGAGGAGLGRPRLPSGPGGAFAVRGGSAALASPRPALRFRSLHRSRASRCQALGRARLPWGSAARAAVSRGAPSLSTCPPPARRPRRPPVPGGLVPARRLSPADPVPLRPPRSRARGPLAPAPFPGARVGPAAHRLPRPDLGSACRSSSSSSSSGVGLVSPCSWSSRLPAWSPRLRAPPRPAGRSAGLPQPPPPLLVAVLVSRLVRSRPSFSGGGLSRFPPPPAPRSAARRPRPFAAGGPGAGRPSPGALAFRGPSGASPPRPVPGPRRPAAAGPATPSRLWVAAVRRGRAASRAACPVRAPALWRVAAFTRILPPAVFLVPQRLRGGSPPASRVARRRRVAPVHPPYSPLVLLPPCARLPRPASPAGCAGPARAARAVAAPAPPPWPPWPPALAAAVSASAVLRPAPSRPAPLPPPLVFCRPALPPRGASRAAPSFVFQVRPLPGCLYKAVRRLPNHGVNMTMLEEATWSADRGSTPAFYARTSRGTPPPARPARPSRNSTTSPTSVNLLGVYPPRRPAPTSPPQRPASICRASFATLSLNPCDSPDFASFSDCTRSRGRGTSRGGLSARLQPRARPRKSGEVQLAVPPQPVGLGNEGSCCPGPSR